MIKLKIIKACLLGTCMALFTSGTAFAAEKENVAAESQIQYTDAAGTSAGSDPAEPESSDAIIKKQAELEQYLFTDHAKEIADKGFNVVHIVPMGTYVEIGILPYNDENAEYLYNIFGTDTVKVVEALEAVTMVVDPGMAVTSTDTEQANPEINSAVTDKQAEIDQYLFVDHAKEIADKGITITHTAPMDSYVEIGILPYNDENTEYLYNIFGKDMVQVIEGVEAETMSITSDGGDQVQTVSSPITKGQEAADTGKNTIPILPISIAGIAGIIIIAGGTVILNKNRKAAKR